MEHSAHHGQTKSDAVTIMANVQIAREVLQATAIDTAGLKLHFSDWQARFLTADNKLKNPIQAPAVICHQVIDVGRTPAKHLDNFNSQRKQKASQCNRLHVMIFLVQQRQEKSQRDKQNNIQNGINWPSYHTDKWSPRNVRAKGHCACKADACDGQKSE